MDLRLPPLPYSLDALEPHISARTLALHHGRHHRGYVERVNELAAREGFDGARLEELVQHGTGSLLDNASQAWNHTFYWRSMTPSSNGWVADQLLRAIRRRFGGMDGLHAILREAALGVLGSGWVWLVQEGGAGRLEVLTSKDADCPLREGKHPLLACDIWEHAYYIDYQNERGDYFDAWWRLANWEFAGRNLLSS